jgi:hypothetical protein
MGYLKSLLFCFLVVFFVDYLVPGVEVVSFTKLPHIGGDLIFAAGLGLVNFLVGTVLQVSKKGSLPRLAIAILVLNFAAYALVKLLPLGVFTTSVEGYALAALAVTIGCGGILYINQKKRPEQAPHHHHHHEEPHQDDTEG